MPKKLHHVSAVMLILTLLSAACAAQPTATQAPAATQVSAATQAAAATQAPAATQASGVTLKIVGPWLASEADAFQIVLDGFTQSTGIAVQYEGTSDIPTLIGPRLAAGTPPDLAVLPVAKGLRDYVKQGALVPLDDLATQMSKDFAPGYLSMVTLDGHLYAVPTRADLENLLWYNPATLGAQTPADWSAFIAFCDKLAADKKACTAGLAKDSWTLTILFEAAYVATNGSDQYMKLFSGQIPFTDPSVVETMNRMATYYGDTYAAGGRTGALGTGLVDGSARVFGTSPDAAFLTAGSWEKGVVAGGVNKDVVDGQTIDYELFPGEAAGRGAIVVATDVAVVFVKSPEALKLAAYLASVEGQALFTKSGYTVSNKNVDASVFSGLSAKTANLLATSTDVAPDFSMLIPYELVAKLTDTLGAAVLTPDKIGSQLDAFQKEAAAYFAE